MSRLITLLTDFGTADSYVGEVRGILYSLAPTAVVVDVTHEVPPGDVAAANYILGRAWRTFPPGTVHLAVVDPGVGTPRRALAAEAAGHAFVAPDNGLLSDVFAAAEARVVSLPIPATASRTFHGRDVFAPAAARLATGTPLAELGERAANLVHLPPRKLLREGPELVGQVVYVDGFGTLITNLPGDGVAPGGTVRLGPHAVALRSTFADVPPGEAVAFIGSGGAVEIAVRGARADVVLGMSRGVEVTAPARAP